MPCSLDERVELHLPEQIIDEISLFAVNVTSDVSNQGQQSQIDYGFWVSLLNQLHVVKVLLLLKIINTIKIDIGKRNQKMQLMLVNSQLLKDQFQIILQTAPILLIYFSSILIQKLLITFYVSLICILHKNHLEQSLLMPSKA